MTSRANQNAAPSDASPKSAAPAAKNRHKLTVEGLSLRFGGIVALDDLTFGVSRDVICGLIGPNGAGKTSLFNCISRLYNPSSGRIRYEGSDITGLKARDIAALGIARTFQNLALMRSLTVLENVMLGGHHHGRTGFIRAALVPTRFRPEEEALRRTSLEILEHLELDDLAHERVDSLSYPTQKKIELARALASRPTFLMLDEPAGGLSHSEVDDLSRMLQRIRQELSLTLLLVEHHMGMVMNISNEIVVLDFGHMIASGTPETVKSDPRVIEAYLGKRRERA